MPVEVPPNRIELSTLTGGYAPDPEEGSLPLDQTPDVLNFLPDVNSGSIELRKGFERLDDGRLNGLQGDYYIRHVNYYEVIESGSRKRYLICILSTGVDNVSGNIRIYAYDLLEDTFTRIDQNTTWAKAKTEHWYAIVEGTYYGGTRGHAIYSWHPTDGWASDPTTPDVDLWVDTTGNGIAASGEKARDYAFKKGMKVEYNSKYYSTLRNVRFKTWESDEHYSKGERVSRKVDHGTDTYWRSFECLDGHTSSSANRPGDGSDTALWKEKWKNVRLKNIKDEDGDVTADWAYMPLPGRGVVGVYHGFRLWVRHDDADNWSRLQYSAPAKPEKDTLISDLDWRPTDWAPVDDNDGDGGGWFTVPFQKGDAIRALHSFGSYLLIFGRWESFVLAGTNEQTWNLRPLGKIGAIGPQSVTEHDGLVYFWSVEGTLNVTDGTSWQEVPGMEKVREHIKDRTDKLMLGQDDFNWYPALQSYGAFVFMSLPDNNSSDETIVYHPKSESFWLTDLPILDMTVGEKGRTQRMWFVPPQTIEANQTPIVFQYLDDPGNEQWTDDDWQGTDATVQTNGIDFYWRSPWFSFGTTRNERRIRRVWALLRATDDFPVGVTTYRNYSLDPVTTVTRTAQGSRESEFVEGLVAMTTGYSYALDLAGTAWDQFAVHGVGIDTEPRRTRFHRGDGS